jgi:hypothetical protein
MNYDRHNAIITIKLRPHTLYLRPHNLYLKSELIENPLHSLTYRGKNFVGNGTNFIC